MKYLFYFILISVVIFAASPNTVRAQDEASAIKAVEKSPNEFRLWVKHDHLRKFCEGELVINEEGIEYATAFEKHERYWDFVDIKLLKLISETEIEVKTYTTYRPKLTLQQSLPVGRDESFRFKLLEGEMTQEISNFLQSKIKKPMMTTFIDVDDETARPVYSLPVRHRHRWGGCSGVLKVYDDKVIYQSYTEMADSRLWRWSDMQSMGRSGPYQFEITTYEPQFGGPTKSYNFDLKEAMSDEVYDFLWKKIHKVTYYAPSPRKP
jgi:hypothetical protein